MNQSPDLTRSRLLLDDVRIVSGLNEDGSAIEGFEQDDCQPVRDDATRRPVVGSAVKHSPP